MIRLVQLICVALGLALVAGTALAQPTTAPTTGPSSQPSLSGSIDYNDYNALLQMYVNAEGLVNYAGWAANEADKARLEAFIASVAAVNTDEIRGHEEMAFWVNVYNAIVLKQILDHWPLTRVLDIDGFFSHLRYNIGGEMMSLNEMLDAKLREGGGHEARFHFAINPGAIGAAPLRNQAYTSTNLEQWMEEQAVAYVRATTRTIPDDREIWVSKLFEWYAWDFEYMGAFRGFIADRAYAGDEAFVRSARNFFHFFDFDWTLNTQ